MAEKVILDFDPTESEFATYLFENRDSIENRYFTEGENSESKFLRDCEDLLNKENTKTPLVVALVQGPLNSVVVNYYRAVGPFVPKGSKLNAKVFFEDLERFLAEDIKKTKESTLSAELNPFIRKIAAFLVNATKNALEKKYGAEFEKKANIEK